MLRALVLTAFLFSLSVAASSPEALNAISSGPAPILGEPLGGASAPFSKMSCSELFSRKTPGWAIGASGADFFKPQAGGATLNWFPMCSWYFLRSQGPLDTQTERVRALNGVAREFRKLDSCVGSSAQNALDSQIGDLTQNQAHVAPLSVAERRAQLARLEQVRDFEALRCCGSDLECQGLIKKIPAEFCSAQARPDVPDPCTGILTVFHNEDRALELEALALRKYKNARALAGHFPVHLGRFILSPFKAKATGLPEDHPSELVHEWGHACSSIRRQLLANRGDEIEFEYSARRGCDIDPRSDVGHYLRLWKAYGLSDQSLSCVLGLARIAGQKRFEKSPCPGACPRKNIEESFAELQAWLMTPESELVPGTVPGDCMGKRNATHPLDADLMRCAVQDPAILARFEKAAGCVR